jgi:tetratricopeptide (TPR) repeat protein
LYYPHNIHFLAVAAFLEGSSKKAIDAAWMIQRNALREFIGENATVQHYYSIPYYVLVQFGKWDDILRLKYPGETLKYPAAIWHYARGMAFAAKGEWEKAGNELWALNSIASDESLGKLMIWETNSAAQLVSIASHVLTGEIAAWKKDYKKAFEVFAKAIAIEDALNYQEPPDWFFSVRHTLGHWLMVAGETARAEKVYLEDLSNFKENGWALIGLYNSLQGQGREIAAREVKQRFEKAWKWADMRINSSRVY